MKRFVYAVAIVLIMLGGCKPKGHEEPGSIIPPTFTVDVPDALSAEQPAQKSTVDTLEGSQIYEHLRYFIHVGESASQIVQDIMNAIREYNLSQNVSFSYSGDDGRVKNVVVRSNVAYNGEAWEYGMQITDAELESGDDGGVAMQVFWNLNPVQGVAILKPSYINVDEYDSWDDCMVKIEYSEADPLLYDKYMIVSVVNLPMDGDDRFAVKNLKMFVGAKSTRTDVYGNTQHPNAWLLLPDHKGYDWAFVASAFPSEEIAVAQVGLPPDTLDESSRNVLLEDYSVYNVLRNEINQWYYQQYGQYPDSTLLSQYLVNAQAPAHFTNRGFVPQALAINPMFKDLESFIATLSPYNPRDVADMRILFASFPTQVK